MIERTVVKRDTRMNLLFLACFLAISLPGAVILFRKKLDPNSARMDQPDAVVQKLPYMAPPLARPGVRWVVPALTQDWLTKLNQQHGGGPALLSSRPGMWSPVISGDHLMQVAELSQESAGAHASIILWDTSANPASNSEFSLFAAGAASQSGRVDSVQMIAVPEPLKRELMSMNEVQPPVQIAWMRVTFTKWPRSGVVTISGDFQGRMEPHHSTLTIESTAARAGTGK